MPKIFNLALHDEAYDKAYQIDPVSPNDLILTTNRPFESLDGEWGFLVDPYENGMRKKWFNEVTTDKEGRPLPMDYDFDHMELVHVPSSFNTETHKCLYYEGMTWYSRKFGFKPGSKAEKVFLYFEGANDECRVWLNQKYIARHLGGSTPFCVEVTGMLKEQNRLVVMVNNSRRPDRVPALNTDWFNYGGLYRSVNLYRVPAAFVRDMFIRLRPDGRFNKIDVSVSVEGEVDHCTVEIPELGICKQFQISGGKGKLEINAGPILWCPENPKLYDVIIRYGNDVLQDKIGFREISIHGSELLLNGKPLFLRGISIHEDHIDFGKTFTEQVIRDNFAMARELNCNFIRLAHYPHSRIAALIADEMGLMLWEEIPVYWTLMFDNPDTQKCALNQLQELVLRDRNRASVCIWSAGNENPDTDERLTLMCRLIEEYKRLDETRPVSAACLVNYDNLVLEDRLTEYVDIIGINEYFGWYRNNMGDLSKELSNLQSGKPVLISEFGADALAGYNGTDNVLFTEEYQENFYRKQLEILLSFDKVKGIIPWILFDFRSPRRQNQFQRGFNRKGLVAADRETRKLAFYTLQKSYQKLKETRG